MSDLLAGPLFELPPVLHTVSGGVRTVGIELEFIGLSAQLAAHRLADTLGGAVVFEDVHGYAVEGSSIGDFAVRLDTRYAHPKKKGRTFLADLDTAISEIIGAAASVVVPAELDTGPMPMDRIGAVEEAVAVLREAGARGTQDAPLYAFALHFNVEPPSRDAATIVRYLQSFALLNAWLRQEAAPDPTRALLGFADPFPDAFVRHIIEPGYAPDLARFITDYLAYNPTRNRDLDLLPLLAHLDEARVRERLPAEKINSRPTFHYRLPDARVSDPAWSIAVDWNRWVAIERLANDAGRLAALRDAYLSRSGDLRDWARLSSDIAFA